VSELGEIYGALKEIRREEKAAAFDAAFSDEASVRQAADAIGYRLLIANGGYHWRFVCPRGRPSLDYWPSTGKARRNGRGLYFETPKDVIAELAKETI
jgi:hypothetical protein